MKPGNRFARQCSPQGPINADLPYFIKTNVLCVSHLAAVNFYGMPQSQTDLSDRFAQVVQRHRTKKGLSRAALAEKAGLHQTYIGLLERGHRSPNLDTAKSIANALEVPLAKLVVEAEKLLGKASKF